MVFPFLFSFAMLVISNNLLRMIGITNKTKIRIIKLKIKLKHQYLDDFNWCIVKWGNNFVRESELSLETFNNYGWDPHNTLYSLNFHWFRDKSILFKVMHIEPRVNMKALEKGLLNFFIKGGYTFTILLIASSNLSQ